MDISDLVGQEEGEENGQTNGETNEEEDESMGRNIPSDEETTEQDPTKGRKATKKEKLERKRKIEEYLDQVVPLNVSPPHTCCPVFFRFSPFHVLWGLGGGVDGRGRRIRFGIGRCRRRHSDCRRLRFLLRRMHS